MRLQPSRTRRVTQQQTAEIVGVSNVTVSHVLHRPHNARISEETRRDIVSVAQELGYSPRNVTSHTIGFVIAQSEMHLDTTENAIIFAHETLKARGYHMLFAMVDENKPESLRQVLNQKTVDGVMFNCWCGGKIENLLPDEIPWVLLSEDGVGQPIDQVSTGTVESALQTARHLISLGHKRLCLVAGPQSIGYHKRLKNGLVEALKEAGLPTDIASVEVLDNGEIGAPLLKHMASSQPPTAILAASAGKAIVVLNRLLGAGICVPRDVSLVSFGDSYRLKPLAPSISACTIFDRDVIEGGVERLIQKIKTPSSPPERTFLTGNYIERESVSTPKES